MNTKFQDLQNEHNPHDGQVISDRETAASLLDDLRNIRPPFMCQFTGDDGFNLVVGIGRDFGCVQHSSNDGMPPFLLAVSKTGSSNRNDMEFLVGDTTTPINGRYRIPFDALREIVVDFVTTGQRNSNVTWDELDPAD